MRENERKRKKRRWFENILYFCTDYIFFQEPNSLDRRLTVLKKGGGGEGGGSERERESCEF